MTRLIAVICVGVTLLPGGCTQKPLTEGYSKAAMIIPVDYLTGRPWRVVPPEEAEVSRRMARMLPPPSQVSEDKTILDVMEDTLGMKIVSTSPLGNCNEIKYRFLPPNAARPSVGDLLKAILTEESEMTGPGPFVAIFVEDTVIISSIYSSRKEGQSAP